MQANISGTYNFKAQDEFKTIQQQDVYLFCDTSTAPVIINLPAISTFGGFLNVKIYVTDVSANASVNTITINSAGLDLINQASSVIINTNSGSAMVIITNRTQWQSMSPTFTANNSNIVYSTTASGTNTYTAPVPTGVSSIFSRMKIAVTFTNGNTGASTLQIGSYAVINILKAGIALMAGDIAGGGLYILEYDGTNFQMAITSEVGNPSVATKLFLASNFT